MSPYQQCFFRLAPPACPRAPCQQCPSLPGPCITSPPARSSLLLPAHTVSGLGDMHALEGKGTTVCLLSKALSRVRTRRRPTQINKNWEGIASGPSAGTYRGSILQIKKIPERRGQKEAGHRAAVGGGQSRHTQAGGQ